jgi:Sec7-like guanine-nucleotide exchange factor
MDRKTLLNGIQVDIKTYISEDSMEKFKDDVRKLSKRIPEDTKYVIIELYLQLGKQMKNIIIEC